MPSWYSRTFNRTIFQSPESRTLIVQNAIESQFLQAENESFVAFFLSKELRFFETSKIYCDGTFDICRNFSNRFSQLYIISTTQTVLDRVISTPICFFFMKARRATNYTEIVDIKKVASEKAYSCPFQLKCSHGFSQALYRLSWRMNSNAGGSSLWRPYKWFCVKLYCWFDCTFFHYNQFFQFDSLSWNQICRKMFSFFEKSCSRRPISNFWHIVSHSLDFYRYYFLILEPFNSRYHNSRNDHYSLNRFSNAPLKLRAKKFKCPLEAIEGLLRTDFHWCLLD